jgi:hypothetical protein
MMSCRVLRMESKSPGQSQLRRRFELGGDSTSTTLRNVIPFDRRSPNERPTLPTPRPRMSLGTVPTRLVDDKGMMALPLDPCAAFVLVNVDGKTPLGSLADVTGIPPEEVLLLVERLVELKAVAQL